MASIAWLVLLFFSLPFLSCDKSVLSEPEVTRPFIQGSCPIFGPVSQELSGCCRFVHEPNKSDIYLQELSKSTKHAKDNKIKLFSLYADFYQKNYSKIIENSAVELYQVDKLTDHDLLSVVVPLQVGPNLFEAVTGITYKLNPGPYVYQQHEAFVDFANMLIGGGVFDGGWVQEEIELYESTFLPWASQVRVSAKDSVDWCGSVKLKSLDVLPAVLRIRQFIHVDIDRQPSIYGGGYQAIPSDQLVDYLKVLDTPIDFYSPAIAAIEYRHPHKGSYLVEDIKKMTLVAARAFYATMVAMHGNKHPIVIHTGNWGAGAFNNSRKTTWAIQIVALQAAAKIFKAKFPQAGNITYVFNAYDKKSESWSKEALTTFNQEMASFNKSLSLENLIDLIQLITTKDITWQIQAKP